MCLAVPGKILSISDDTASVDFQGTTRAVSLVMTPDAKCHDWVLVHAGFAIAQVDEAEARQTWDYLAEIDALEQVIK